MTEFLLGAALAAAAFAARALHLRSRRMREAYKALVESGVAVSKDGWHLWRRSANGGGYLLVKMDGRSNARLDTEQSFADHEVDRAVDELLSRLS